MRNTSISTNTILILIFILTSLTKINAQNRTKNELEPNDSAKVAMEIFSRDYILGNIQSETDIDYYKFYAEAGDTILILGGQRNNSFVEGAIYVYDSNENYIGSNNYYLKDLQKQRFLFKVGISGYYYIKYSDNNIGNNGATKGEYYILIYNEYTVNRAKAEKVTVDNLIESSASLKFAFYPNSLPTKATIEYGTTTSYSNSLLLGDYYALNIYNAIHPVILNELIPNTKYYYRLKLENDFGIDFGEDSTFTTPNKSDEWKSIKGIGKQNANYYLESIDFVNDNIGFIAHSNNNNLLKTTDGGNNWAPVTSLPITNSYLYSIDFLNSGVGIISNRDGEIYLTNNAGNSWNKILDDQNISITSLKLFENNIIYAFGSIFDLNDMNYKGVILKSYDNGLSWNQKIFSNIPDGFLKFRFINSLEGWALGNFSKIYKTTDGGINWIEQTSGITNGLSSIDFYDSNNGIAVGYGSNGGPILRTSNGGNSWQKINSGLSGWGSFGDVHYLNSNQVKIVGGNGIILSSQDGGLNWTQDQTGTTNSLQAITTTPNGTVFAVGNYGTILKKDGNSVSSVWQTDISISDAGGVRTGNTLTFGQDKNASDGLDAGLGEIEQPPAPPSGTFDAVLVLTDNKTRVLKDFRNSDSTKIKWQIKLQPGLSGYPITLSWDASKLPQGSFTLKDMLGGVVINQNMKTSNTVQISNSGISGLIIEYNEEVCVDVTVNKGWNLLSIPVLPQDRNKDTIFPNSTSNAFYFEGSYKVADSLELGLGYWLKFGNGETINICGEVGKGKIKVTSGWNMVGVFENTVVVNTITSVPSGIITSQFFEFDNGYDPVDTLKPGKGYWVKVNQAGELNYGGSTRTLAKTINKLEIGKEWNSISIVDEEGSSSVLYSTTESIDLSSYDLPPVPPIGIKDVRFGSSRMVENLNNNESIKLQSLSYPIVITISGMDVRIKDKVGGSILNKIVRDGDKVVISNPSINEIEIESIEIPVSYQLSQNYPNPFNPSTKIKYGLPEKTNVRLEIYNVLGEKVVTLVNQEMDMGYHEIEFNGSKLSSGVYIYRIHTDSFTDVKKMLILK